jgi:CheY-like chemotaxis protein
VQSNRLVLVVSNDPEERERAVSAVLDLGHAVLCAESDEHALAVLAESPSIDVVIADAAGGSAFARRLQERRPDVAMLHSIALLDWVESAAGSASDRFPIPYGRPAAASGRGRAAA